MLSATPPVSPTRPAEIGVCELACFVTDWVSVWVGGRGQNLIAGGLFTLFTLLDYGPPHPRDNPWA